MNFTKFKLKGLLSIAMLVGILTTSMGIESLAFSKDSIKLSDKQVEKIKHDLDEKNIEEYKQARFIEKIKENKELDSSKYLKNNNFELTVDLYNNEKESYLKTFEDGSYISIEVEDASPSELKLRGLTYNGKKITGSNGAATQTYYIDTRPHKNNSKYTVLTKAYAITTTVFLGDYSNESIRKHRTWEDASQPVWVEGYAKFHYFGNQWVQLWNHSGGVRSKIKNNKLTVSLY